MVGSLHQDDLAELNRLLTLLSDAIDGLESAQVLYADPFIEAQLADLRFVRDRLAKRIECLENSSSSSAPLDEESPARHPKEQTT